MASYLPRLSHLLVLVAAVTMSACAALGVAPVSRSSTATPEPNSSVDTPATARPQSNASAASAALLAQSRTERAAGHLSAASASVERALRLDPNNPYVWLELGEVQLASGDTAQAATMARKAVTLANGDSVAEARAEQLLRAASK